jgi:hypothetical protein
VWEIWSNGLYKSTLHRVVHRGSNYRYVFLPFNVFSFLINTYSASQYHSSMNQTSTRKSNLFLLLFASSSPRRTKPTTRMSSNFASLLSTATSSKLKLETTLPTGMESTAIDSLEALSLVVFSLLILLYYLQA